MDLKEALTNRYIIVNNSDLILVRGGIPMWIKNEIYPARFNCTRWLDIVDVCIVGALDGYTDKSNITATL